MIVGIWVILGLLVGALLNHLADRLPQHRTVRTRPVCSACGAPSSTLQWFAIPAKLAGRDKCRTCSRPQTSRRPMLEAGVAAVYGLLAWYYGLSWALVAATFHAAVLCLVVVTDLEERKVPDLAVLPAIAVTLAYTAALCPACLPTALLGGAIAFLLFLLCTLFHMGFGDVKLAAYIGVIAGYPLVFQCLLVAVIAGGVAAGIGLLTGRLARRSYMPYAPYLALGGALALYCL